MENEIVNRVAKSPLITINLEEYYNKDDGEVIDLKDQLFQGLILREKDFRAFVKSHDWESYRNKYVGITCSADAIIPVWAYMLITTKLTGIAKKIMIGDESVIQKEMVVSRMQEDLNLQELKGKKIVIKGCSKYDIPESAYVEVTKILTPIVQSIMYGEPCSTVPVYKAK